MVRKIAHLGTAVAGRDRKTDARLLHFRRPLKKIIVCVIVADRKIVDVRKDDRDIVLLQVVSYTPCLLPTDDHTLDLHLAHELYDRADITVAFGSEEDRPFAADVRNDRFEAKIGCGIRQGAVLCMCRPRPAVVFGITEDLFQFLDLRIATLHRFIEIDGLRSGLRIETTECRDARKIYDETGGGNKSHLTLRRAVEIDNGPLP